MYTIYIYIYIYIYVCVYNYNKNIDNYYKELHNSINI